MWHRLYLGLALLGLAVLLFSTTRDTPAQQVKETILAVAPEPPVKDTVTGKIVVPVKIAASRVIGVTVYPNSALVTREVDVPEGAGPVELTVSPLPPSTIQSSLYTEGSESLRIMITRFRTRSIPEDTRAEVRKLQEELKTLQAAREKLEAEQRSIQADSAYLTKLESFSNVTAVHTTTEKGAPNAESVIAMAKYIMETRAMKSKATTELQQQIQANQESSDVARRKLSELTSGVAKIERDAVIVVEKTNNAGGKIRLNYLVDSAAWAPQYKFRAGKAVKDQVQLEYLAAVVQNTGEDWSGVKLVLSTAKPMLNAAPPELQSLKVAVVPKNGSPTGRGPDAMELDEQVKSLRSKAQMHFNEGKQSTGIGFFNTAAALDQSFELLNPDEAVKRGCFMAVREGPSVTYHLTNKLTIPSRPEEQVIEVSRLDMPPEYYYKAVPLLTQHVYRLAELTNRSDFILLPGEATMYIGSDFVGQMSLPLVAIGEKFTVGFGVDPQLQVQRQMVDRAKSTQGGNQALRFEFRILVNSYKSERVKMQVWDRLPHAESDAVGISLTKTTPELSKDELYVREQRPDNLLRWDVQIDPGMTGAKAFAINYEFKMELDRQMTISSFQSAGVFANSGTPNSSFTALTSLSPADQAKVKTQMAKLAPEDRKVAENQLFCAIDQDSALGTMGPIYKVMIKDKPVFLCCKGCVAEAQAHPDETLQKLNQLINRQNPKK